MIKNMHKEERTRRASPCMTSFDSATDSARCCVYPLQTGTYTHKHNTLTLGFNSTNGRLPPQRTNGAMINARNAIGIITAGMVSHSAPNTPVEHIKADVSLHPDPVQLAAIELWCGVVWCGDVMNTEDKSQSANSASPATDRTGSIRSLSHRQTVLHNSTSADSRARARAKENN